MKNKEMLNRVHDFLGEVVRDCPDQEMGLKASNLADNVWDVVHATEGLTFGQAVEACQYEGAKIRRPEWNSKDYVYFDKDTSCFAMDDNGISFGWGVTQYDMAASDWCIVE